MTQKQYPVWMISTKLVHLFRSRSCMTWEIKWGWLFLGIEGWFTILSSYIWEKSTLKLFCRIGWHGWCEKEGTRGSRVTYPVNLLLCCWPGCLCTKINVLTYFFVCFRIKITGILDYSPHSEDITTDPVASADIHVPLEPPLPQENIVTKKPILMVKVENVLHEPFKLTEEVKVWWMYHNHNMHVHKFTLTDDILSNNKTDEDVGNYWLLWKIKIQVLDFFC